MHINQTCLIPIYLRRSSLTPNGRLIGTINASVNWKPCQEDAHTVYLATVGETVTQLRWLYAYMLATACIHMCKHIQIHVALTHWRYVLWILLIHCSKSHRTMPITNHGAPHSLDHSTVFDMYLLCVCLSFLSLRIPAQNIADIVKTKHRHKVDVSDAAWSNDKIKNHLSELGCKKKLPCAVHEGCECPLLSTDLHRLTSPCQGHSDMNGCRQ